MQFLRRIFGIQGGSVASEKPASELFVENEQIVPLYAVEDPPSTTATSNATSVEGEAMQRFNASDPGLLEHLKLQGYVVVKEVCDAGEIREASKLFWNFMNCNDMHEHDPSSWTDENFCKVGSITNGILGYKGIQHSKFLWYIRTLPLVSRAFEQVYNTNELICSYDSGNVFRPWHAGESEAEIELAESQRTMSGWYHVDQGRTIQGFRSVQGLVSLTDVSPESGGFCCVPGTHFEHESLLKFAEVNNDRNFVQCPRNFPGLVNGKRVLPCIKAGDMILWDSRTLHCSTSSIVNKSQIKLKKNELMRIAAYVCMCPKSFASTDVLSARGKLFELDCGTSHWPDIISYLVPTDKPVVNNLKSASSKQLALIGL